MSFSTVASHVFFRLPLLRQPLTFCFLTVLTTSSSPFLFTCPYHLSLPSLIFCFIQLTPNPSLMYSFSILSFLVTPHLILKIFFSATPSMSSCFFDIDQHSVPYKNT